jgi:tRNA-dependent cyclodipeptide synthase
MTDTDNTIFIIGVSPRNPYFKNPENIQFAIDRLMGSYQTLCLFAPGLLDRHNFLAWGYSEEAAERKAEESQWSIAKAMREICIRNDIPLMTCSDAFSNESYQGALEKLSSLYVSNDNFREDVRRATAITIESHARVSSRDRTRIQITGMPAGVDEGIHYLIGELAWLIAVSNNMGYAKAVYHYHKPWPVFERLIAGHYDGNVRPALAFRVLCNPAAKL